VENYVIIVEKLYAAPLRGMSTMGVPQIVKQTSYSYDFSTISTCHIRSWVGPMSIESAIDTVRIAYVFEVFVCTGLQCLIKLPVLILFGEFSFDLAKIVFAMLISYTEYWSRESVESRSIISPFLT
jgi:hypothetical protein